MYFEECTRIGAFVEHQWEFDYYVKFFTEMVERTSTIDKIISSKDQFQIRSNMYRVDIYLGQRLIRGNRYDIVFSSTNNIDYKNEVLLPALNNSKFSDWNMRLNYENIQH